MYNNEHIKNKELETRYLDAIKKCDALEDQVDDWKMQFESTYENYMTALLTNATKRLK